MTETIQRSNPTLWLAAFILLLAIGSIALFFVSTPVQAVLPWLSPLLALAAAIISLVGLRRAKVNPAVYSGKAPAWALTLLSSLVFLFGIFFFYTARHIPAARSAPQVGDMAPDFILPDSNGHNISLSGLLSGTGQERRPKAVLLVFYRGYW